MPLLGKVPLTIPLREHADAGPPLVLEQPEDPAASAIIDIARRLERLAPQRPIPLPMAGAPTSLPMAYG